MKRARPKQHTRRLKSGRVIKVNKGVKGRVKRRKFTPFSDSSKATNMSAARRFGGQNLKGLNKIGSGRDRDVYALDNDKVLKIAKNPGGLTQNTSESDLEYLGFGKHYETGLDYSVMKRNNPLSIKNKRKLATVRKTYEEEYLKNGRDILNNYNRRDAPLQLIRSSKKFSGENNILDEVGIGTEVLDFSPVPVELFANRQWGEDEQGNLALNDGGALQDEDSLRKHRVKDFEQIDRIDSESPTPWQLRDWNETKNQRRIYKNKGNYKE